MAIELKDLKSALEKASFSLAVSADLSRTVGAPHIMSDAEDQPREGAVNLCMLSTYLRISSPGNTVFICCQDCQAPENFPAGEDADIIYCRDDGSIMRVLNIVSDVFAQEARAAQVTSQIYASLGTEHALQIALNIASEAIGCKCVLGDGSRTVLAHTVPDVPAEEQAWRAFIELGIAPSLGHGSPNRPISEMNIAPDLTLRLVENREFGVVNAICDIAIGGRTGACLSMLLERKDLSRTDITVIAALCNAIRLEMNHRSPDTVRQLPYESFLINLLESRTRSDEHIRIFASKLAYPTEGYFSVLAFELPEEMDAPGPTVRELMDGIEPTLEDCRIVNHNGRIIALVNHRNREEFARQDYTVIKNYITRYSLRCGLSRPFTRLADLREHYLEALDAADFARYGAYLDPPIQDNMIIYYERFEPYLLMHTATEQGVDLKKFIHPFVTVLHEFDQTHDTEYVRTLFEYIKTPKKPQCAEALFIHRNTLDYRLKKIQELVSFSWDDGETMSRLYMSVIILSYLEMRKLVDGK
jgi:sugar diacid utilization regulator